MNQSNGRDRDEAGQIANQSATTEESPSAPFTSDGATKDGSSIESDLAISADSDFGWAIAALVRGRDENLATWLNATRDQPFHAARPERAISDDIPRLYDAIVAFLARTSRSWREPGSPMDDEAILSAANAHANVRAEQGLQPSDIVTEFRLLRRAVWAGLRGHIADLDSIENLVNAELLVNDAIDGAITVGLNKLSARVENIREDFLVTTVHDIRQPITSIRGFVQLSQRYLNRQPAEIERALTSLANIEPQIDQLNNTIDFLIDASRAALGQLALEPSFVDLALLIPDIVEQNGVRHLREFRLTIPEEGEATGNWDAARLRRVFDNLLSNALKYSKSGDLVEIGAQATGEQVEVFVRDVGMGLEPEELPKIFSRYYRTPRATRNTLDGSGVGLYLCARIIEQHGGTIWAESDGPETGTTIRFTLPRGTDSWSNDHPSATL
ncbi:MAG TPA: HAMP domain-containing sensor histidine kinase [Nitrolancea sp.]